jgi:hypothetical protein
MTPAKKKPAPVPPTALPSGFRLSASEPVLIAKHGRYLDAGWMGRPVALAADESWGADLGPRWPLERIK